MRDGDDGSARCEPFQRELNLFLRFGIERRCRFVEKKNGRVFQKRARDCETLLLAAGKETAFVADHRLIPLRLRHDEIVRVGSPGRGVNFFLRRVESSELDVLEDRIVKQKCFLRDEADLFAQRSLCDAAANPVHRFEPCRRIRIVQDAG